MKFKVTEYDLVNGVEVQTREYEIEPKELKTVTDNLREAYYRGWISNYEILPVIGGAENG